MVSSVKDSGSSTRRRARLRLLGRTALREWLDWWRDTWLRQAVVAITVLGVAASLVGAWTTTTRDREHAEAQRAEHARWLAQPPRDPHSASHFGLSVFHTPSRLALVDPGGSAYAGSSLFLEAHKQNVAVFAEALDRGAVGRLGDLSLAALLQQWVPLLIVVLAAGAFAAERESGTLRQVLSLGVPPWLLASGKALAVTAVVAAVALPGAIAAVMVGVARGETAWPADTLVRLLVLAAAYAAYLAFWIVLTLAVSAWASSWRLAAAVLTAVWCAWSVVLPRVAVDVARAAHPLPTRAAYERALLDSRKGASVDRKRLEQETLRKYNVSSLDRLPVNFAGIVMQQAEERSNRLIDAQHERLAGIYRAQRATYVRSAWLSPSIAIDILSTAAAGTDDWHYREFLAQGEAYRRAMMRLLNGAIASRPAGDRRRGDANLWARLPPFQYVTPRFTAASTLTVPAAGALVAWLMLVVLAAHLALRRLWCQG